MRLSNPLSRPLEEFVPIILGEVRMYKCGPTVYKRQHIGNFRAFIKADLLRRTREYQGLNPDNEHHRRRPSYGG